MIISITDEDLRILIEACEAFDDRFTGSEDANAAALLASRLETVKELGYDYEIN